MPQPTADLNGDVLTNEAIGARLRALREDRRWSQRELATYIGTYGIRWHQTTVAKIEAGERSLTLREAAAAMLTLAATLNALTSPNA